ncbi:PLP-dependent aminotransferase family protein [Parathalassolituus penaei]|uniref:PLP-dependent aminotransferase family protein n=1 Tax=Parathalassolituus penaei TaxID=2997323 RepID=A0A9X3IR60_9GAMM|nr:PLP-dependent aminotransferase family protein [Parathalassolituus penaei]MCY0963890.1 PLP-dependent aminotransferase family protein [Parathalassolituus penaei]
MQPGNRAIPTTSPLASLTLVIHPDQGHGYQQLQQQIQQAIRNGNLPAGSRLPSSRQLAEQLGVSRSLVIQAYDLLVSEGYLDNRPRSGLFVLSSAQLPLTQPKAHNSVPTQGSRPDITPAPMQAFDAGADVDMFPSRIWANSLKRAWLKPDPLLLQGHYSSGHPALRQAICTLLKQLRGLDCTPAQVFVTAGHRDSLTLLNHLLRQQYPDHHWQLENPCYPPVRQLLDRFGSTDLEMDEEGFQPPPPSGWQALVTPNRQYPLGSRWSARRRLQWLETVHNSNSLIIEDDYDTEFVYSGQPGLPLMQLAQNTGLAREQVAMVGSFSKMMFRGLRLGFLVVPTGWIDAISASQQQLGDSASQTIQPALADFINSGELARHLNRMRRHYRRRRDFLHQRLQQHLQPWFDWDLPADGMQTILYWKAAQQTANPHESPRIDQKLQQQLRVQNIDISLLADHYRQPQTAPAGMRLGFSGTQESTMETLIRTIAATLSTL